MSLIKHSRQLSKNLKDDESSLCVCVATAVIISMAIGDDGGGMKRESGRLSRLGPMRLARLHPLRS